MKISYNWIKEYFDDGASLPKAKDLADLINLRSFEVDDIQEKENDTILDIDVLPNRAHDCLSHYGLAKEISLITDIKLKPLEIKSNNSVLESDLEIKSDNDFCKRYIACKIENVKIGKSPEELKNKLESIGEKSINNIVDITNIVMFSLGQPMHAFDADKINSKIEIRNAREDSNEKITTLDNKNVELRDIDPVITDGQNILAIAGVKGGKHAEVDSNTKNIILESANFDYVTVRKTSRGLNIITESSKRFENEITPEFAEQGISMAIELIEKYASDENTKIYKQIDYYPKPVKEYRTGVSLGSLNNLLGSDYSNNDIENVFDKLNFEYTLIEKPREFLLKDIDSILDKAYKNGASVTNDAPEIFDCSSLVCYLYSLIGQPIPRITIDQFAFGFDISKEELLPGDLIFSNTGEIQESGIYFETQEFLPGLKIEHGVDHVGIYLGENKILHATSKFGKTVIEDLDQADRFSNTVGYKRILKNEDSRFIVKVPKERLDLRISKKIDIETEVGLIEEIGRILGYENIFDQEIKIDNFKPEINKNYYLNKLISKILCENGFSEVFTYSFVDKGVLQPMKPISEDKQYLRDSLEIGFNNALENNIKNADWLGLNQIKIFEIGKVFKKDSEILMLGLGVVNKNGFKKPSASSVLKESIDKIQEILECKVDIKISDQQNFVEINLDDLYQQIDFNKLKYVQYNVSAYPEIKITENINFKKISQYPFMSRDISVWIPNQDSVEELISIIKSESGELLIHEPKQFDLYEKDGKTSYAYRMIYQSYEKTLTDEEVNEIMNRINQKISDKKDWEVR